MTKEELKAKLLKLGIDEESAKKAEKAIDMAIAKKFEGFVPPATD